MVELLFPRTPRPRVWETDCWPCLVSVKRQGYVTRSQWSVTFVYLFMVTQFGKPVKPSDLSICTQLSRTGLPNWRYYSMVEPPSAQNPQTFLRAFVPVHRLSYTPWQVCSLPCHRCGTFVYQSLLSSVTDNKKRPSVSWQRSLRLRRRYSILFSQDVSWQHRGEERPTKKRQSGSDC